MTWRSKWCTDTSGGWCCWLVSGLFTIFLNVFGGAWDPCMHHPGGGRSLGAMLLSVQSWLLLPERELSRQV